MRSPAIVLAFAVFSINAAHAGDIYRCTAANGDVMYTNIACPAMSQVEHVASYEPVPPSPPAPANDAAIAAAASASQARLAAQQARTAAYEARMASQQAQAEAFSEPESESADYATDSIPFYPVYPVFGVGSRDHRHAHHTAGVPPGHPAHHSGAAPRGPMTSPAFYHR